jgi:hypothetical protein
VDALLDLLGRGIAEFDGDLAEEGELFCLPPDDGTVLSSGNLPGFGVPFP